MIHILVLINIIFLFLYLTLYVHLNFIFGFTLSSIFFILASLNYFFKKYKYSNSVNKKTLQNEELSADDHPIIKSARQRLKK